MRDEYASSEKGFRVEALIADVLPEVLAHQDADRFFAWMREHMAQYLSGEMHAQATPEMVRGLAFGFGRALWNALPLPRNRFRPEPIPEPGRNERCPCGSGLKYKQCCRRMPTLPLETEDLWPILLDAMSEEQREAALRGGALPRRALIALAQKRLEAGKIKAAVKLVEPLFMPRPTVHDEPMGIGFDLLCDAYGELGWHKKKAALIDGVIEHSPRSPLRSDAWQRRCLMAMDRHDLDEAREAFKAAQRDDPEAPMIPILEVELLLSEHQPGKARERAGFHVRKFRRLGYPEDEPPLSFLVNMARDPLAGVADLALEQVGEAGRGLLDWLGTVVGRALPEYRVAGIEELPEEEDDLVERLMQMGIERTEAERAVAEMPEPPAEEEDEPDFSPPEPLSLLLGPETLAVTERAWHDCFPLGKPFSIGNEPFADTDVWNPSEERRWTAFLGKHPECFDSLDILDDLASAAMQHPQSGLPALDQAMLQPVLERVRAIVTHAVGEHGDVRLAWIESRNRPALRSLVRLASFQREARPQEAGALAAQVLELNPHDNHGFRCVVINDLLANGEHQRALEIAEDYPDDIMVDVLYGRALALFGLGKKTEATRLLREAVEERPKVADYLIRKSPRQPKLSTFGVTPGGDDEAWLYREEMRDVWAKTPEAMDWLRAECNRWRRRVGKNARQAPKP
ncbi:MAG: SEC-C domain-containing protein [Gammaproteobacteria bacterium]|nr:SEC-C domain-containing protein [Gammaproteobacteria bacterium]